MTDETLDMLREMGTWCDLRNNTDEVYRARARVILSTMASPAVSGAEPAEVDAIEMLAKMPSLWSLKLMFGQPDIEMSVAWGTGAGIVVAESAGPQDNRADAIRRAIERAAAEVVVRQSKGKP